MTVNKTDKLLAIGITGTNAAGKDTVADFFKDKRFNIYSHSDELRNILKDKKIEITRDRLRAEGNKIRRENGNGVLSEIILAKIKLPAVILSIRHPEEVFVYKRKLKTFFLLGVDAPRKIRYKRAVSRGREGEGANQSYEDFVAKEEKEMKSGGERQQIKAVMDMADLQVENGGTLDELNERLEILYNGLITKIQK